MPIQSNIAKKKNVFQTYFIYVAVAFIVSLGFFLRLYNIQEWMVWNDDVGIELLIATHAIKYNELTSIAPVSGTPFAYYTPTYSTLITFLWKFLPSPTLLIYAFCLWGSIGIFFAYLTGKYARNSLCGCIFALLVATSGTLINDSNQILRNSINQPLLLMLGFLLSYWAKNKRVSILFLIIQLSFLSLHFYTSFLPIGLLLILLTTYVIQKTYKQPYVTLTAIGVTVLNVGLYYALAYTSHSGSLISFFHNNISLVDYWSRLIKNVSYTLTLAFPLFPVSIGVIIGFELCFYAGLKILIDPKKYSPLLIAYVFYIVSMVGISFIAQDLMIYRLVIFTPIVYFCISYSITVFPKQIQYILYFLLLYYVIFLQNNFYKFISEPTNTYHDQTVVIDVILQDSQKFSFMNKQASYHLFYMQNVPEFIQSSSTLWYLAEQSTRKRLINIIKTPPYFKPIIVESPTFDYLVCEASEAIHNQFEICKNKFINFYGLSIQRDTLVTLIPKNKTGQKYRIYRWNHGTK